jgi:peptidoglycan hydrolase CwlO-like protein
VQNRPLRQRLTALHARFAPLQKHLAQRQQSLSELKAEQEKLTAELALKREQYKEKNQLLTDIRTFASWKTASTAWKQNVPACNRAMPARFVVRRRTLRLPNIRPLSPA